MELKIDRRTALKAGAALAASQLVPAWAQDKPLLRMTAVFSDKDIRADMYRMIAKDLEGDFRVEQHFMGTLFKQGTSSSPCSATTSRSATSRPRTSPSRFPPGRC